MSDTVRTLLVLLLTFSPGGSLAQAQALAERVQLAPELAAPAPPVGSALPPGPQPLQGLRTTSRVLLATGLGVLVGGAVGMLATAGTHHCYGRPGRTYQGPLYVGTGAMTVGLGLSVAGTIGWARAGREDRRSKVVKLLPLMALGGAALGLMLTMASALPEAVDCWSS